MIQLLLRLGHGVDYDAGDRCNVRPFARGRPPRLLILPPVILLLLLLPIGTGDGREALSIFTTAALPIFVDSGQEIGLWASRDVALGDTDGDGDLDAFVANDDADVYLWLNRGPERPGEFVNSGQIQGGFGAVAVALNDLDGDGDLDGVALTGDFDDAVHIFVNEGPATLGAFTRTAQTITGLFTGLATGDADGDGNPDLFLTAHGQGDQVWLNDGGTPPQFSDSGQRLGSSGSAAVTLGDLDGDGDRDAYVANMLQDDDAANTVYFNQTNDSGGSAGQFDDSGQRLGGSLTAAVALGDVDGDGDRDALASNFGANRLWLNDGSGQFTDSGQVLENRLSTESALADLDGDGDLDTFVANLGPDSVWSNDGNGLFANSGQLLGSTDSYSVALGDVDGDGFTDAFVAGDGPNKVWLNQRTAPGNGAEVSVSLLASSYREIEGSSCRDTDSDFIVEIQNAGAKTATNVTVHAREGQINGSSTYNLGSLPPGVARTVILRAVPYVENTAGGPILCWATADVTVTADQADPVPANNRAFSRRIDYSCSLLSCGLEMLFCENTALRGSDSQPISIARRLLQPFQEAAVDLLVYSLLRDEILAKTAAGRHYVDLYYAHDPEIRELLEVNPNLKGDALDTLQRWEPHLWALVQGTADQQTITTEQVAAVDTFLADLAAVASSDLRAVIAAERARLPAPETFAGLTVAQARGLTIGYAAYLPVVARE